MFILTPSIKAAIAAAAFFDAQTATDLTALDCSRSVYVAPGATCNLITARDRVSIFQLRHVNPWINSGCTNLPANKVICIGYKGQDCTSTYVVATGDICDVITRRFGISLDTLRHNNPNVNPGCTNLYPGEVLCVSGTQYNYGPGLDEQD